MPTFPRRKPPPRRRTGAGAVAAIESLEERRLLSAVISIEAVQPVANEGTLTSAEFRISNSGDDWGLVTWTVIPGSASLVTDLPQYPDMPGGETHTLWVPAGGAVHIMPTIMNDFIPEPEETFSVSLSVPVEWGLGLVEITSGTANGRIEDDDVMLVGGSTTITAGDTLEWVVRAIDYYGKAVSGVPVYVEGGQGPVGTLFPHDLTDGNGEARIGVRGTGNGWGYVTLRAYDDGKVDARSRPSSFWHQSAPPVMKWTVPQMESQQQVQAPFDGQVRIGVELWKYDGSSRLEKAGLRIEWGMDHSGDWGERQGDLGDSAGLTDESATAHAWVGGNVVQRMFRDMDPTPTGSTTLWAKYALTHTFKRATVRAVAPVIDLRVGTNALRALPPEYGNHKATLSATVNTPQGLPVAGCRLVVTTLEATDDLLGFIYNNGGGGPGSNTVYSSYSDVNGRVTFPAKVSTFAPVGTVATAQLVAQCARDAYYSWRNADVETIYIT
jgi:hypothetical protein